MPCAHQPCQKRVYEVRICLGANSRTCTIVAKVTTLVSVSSMDGHRRRIERARAGDALVEDGR